MATILFKNATLLDATNKQVRPGYQVLVKDNLIAEISTGEITSQDAEVFDLKGKILMPGLIDAHVHVTAAEIDLANDFIADSEVAVQAARFLENMLMRGFTSIRD